MTAALLVIRNDTHAQVPASMRPTDKASNLAEDMVSTGLNHIAFDVGPAIDAGGLDGLRGFLSELNREVRGEMHLKELKN